MEDEPERKRESMTGNRDSISSSMSAQLNVSNAKSPVNASRIQSPQQGKEMLQQTMKNIKETIKDITPVRGFTGRLDHLLNQFDAFEHDISTKIEKFNRRIDALEREDSG